MHLSWIDYAIVLIYVGGTIVAGTLARGAIKGISDFLVAGRGLKTHMAVATYVSTGLGLVTVMYMAEEGFKYGFVPFIFGVMALITTVIIGRTGFIVSRLRHLQVMTVPEFYELKYTRGVRLLGGIILTLAGTLNMGLFPILGSKFVVGFTGLDKEYVNYVMVAMLVIVVFYTLMGGMVSVVLTDFAQFVLLAAGFFFGTYIILTHPQLGWDNMVQAVQTQHGDIGFDPIANPGYGISMILFLFCVNLVGVVWQPEMMRPLSAESPKVARRVFWIASATVMGRAMVPMFWGIAAMTYFATSNPDLHPHYAMPQMLGEILPIGIAGLMMAGMFAAFMSTHDSYLLAWSGVIVRDVVSPIKAILAGSGSGRAEDGTWGGLSSEQEIYWVRAIVVILAAFLAIFGALYQLPETAFRFMYVTGSIYFSGCVGTIALGLYWKKANTPGAYCALILGALVPINFLIMTENQELVPDFLLPLVENSNLVGLTSLIVGGLAMLIVASLTQKSHPPRPLNFSDME